MAFFPHLTPTELAAQSYAFAYAGGYRLRSIAMYGMAGLARYATVWQPQPNAPAFGYADQLYSQADVSASIEYHKTLGYYPVHITGVDTYGLQEYLVWFEESDPPQGAHEVVGWVHLSEEALLSVINGSGYAYEARSIDFYPTEDDNRGCVILYPTPPGPRPGVSAMRLGGVLHPMNDPRHQAMMEGWCYPDMTVPGLPSTNDMLSVWRSDRVYEPWPSSMLAHYTGGTWLAGPVNPSMASQKVSQLEAQGWKLAHIGANGRAGDARLTLTFRRRFKPLSRRLVVVEGLDTGPDRVPPPSLQELLEAKADDTHPDLEVGGSAPPPQPKPWPRLSAASLTLARSRIGFESITGVRREGGFSPRWRPTVPSPEPGGGGDNGGGSIDPDTGHGHPQAAGPEEFETLEEGIERINEIVIEAMTSSGARALQLAIGYEGRLPIVRSYTLAEEGYPVIHAHHRLRIGSISKALTATAIVKEFAVGTTLEERRAGLQRNLPDVFGFSSGYFGDPRSNTTLDMMMAHASGWADESNVNGDVAGNYAVGGDWFERCCIVASGRPLPVKYPARPGDTAASWHTRRRRRIHSTTSMAANQARQATTMG